MKVKFLKDYRHSIKLFQKGDIAVLHWTLGNVLLKKKVVKETNEITEEDIFIKSIKEDGNNGEN